jgi:hypothetical protein
VRGERATAILATAFTNFRRQSRAYSNGSGIRRKRAATKIACSQLNRPVYAKVRVFGGRNNVTVGRRGASKVLSGIIDEQPADDAAASKGRQLLRRIKTNQ